MMRISAFNPADNTCWQFCNPGDRWRFPCQCPACTGEYGNRTLVHFGRCRSGQRWFWLASTYDETGRKAVGFAASEDEVTEAAMAAVRSFSDGKPILARVHQGWASLELKEINRAKRLAKPPPKTRGAHNVEYIWSWSRRYRVIKRTAKRIYYWSTGERLDEHFEPYDDGNYTDRRYTEAVGILDRQRFESGKDKFYSRYYFPSREALLAEHNRYRFKPASPADLAALKEEMANVHPDRGGSSAAFIEARARYVAARRMARGAA